MPRRLTPTSAPRLIATLVVVAWAVALAAAASARASTSYVQTGEIPGFGFPVGGVGVDRTSGDFYVVDAGSAVVDKYDQSGTLLSSFGGPGSGNGQFGRELFSGPAGIAVDPATGDVYVVDRANDRVEKFGSSGAYISQFNGNATPAGGFSSPSSVTVDPNNGDVYVLDAGHDVVDKFDSAGNLVTAFATNGALDGVATPASRFAFALSSNEPLPGLVVDASGRLYVADAGDGVLDEFSSGGEYQGQLGAGTVGAPAAVALDSVGEVFVVDSSDESIVEFDSAGSPLAGFPAGTTRTVRGIASSTDGKRLYLSTLAPFFSELTPVLILAQVTLPDVVTAPASGVSQISATIRGAVSPDGVQLTDCHFLYTDDADFKANGYSGPGSKAPPCLPTPGSIPADHGEHAVTADLSGLAPNTTYHFRLVAANASGSNDGQDRTFTTPGPPSVDATSVRDVGATEAILAARINPERFATTYRFEYGATTAYGASDPVPDGALGSGSSDQQAVTAVTGLLPGTAYHYRVVAGSAQGTTLGPDHTFTTYPPPTPPSGCPNERLREENNSTALPDCRAYELVTPSEKDGNGVGLPKEQPDAFVAAGGGRVEYAPDTTGSFGDATNALSGRFVASRGPGGWESTYVALPTSAHPELSDAAVAVGASGDLSRIFYQTTTSLDPLDQNNATDVYARNADRSVSWISQNGTVSTAPVSSEFAAASNDGSHALFQTTQTLTPPAQSLHAGNELYERIGEETNLVAVRTDGSLISACGAIAGSGRSETYGGTLAGSISGDGSRVFFESPDPRGSGDPSCSPAQGGTQPVELYVRQDGSSTTEISLSQRASTVGTPAPDGVTFRGAASDGSRVLFTSPDLLTGDAALQPGELEALYAYDLGTGALEFIASGVPMTARGGSPMISADATHIYLLGSVPGKGPSGRGLYLWDQGTVSYISPAPVEQAEASTQVPLDARASADGSALAFTAAQNLTGYDSQGRAEIYLYRASDSSLVCISCDPTGSTPPSALWPYAAPDFGGAVEVDPGRALSQAVTSDGNAVFFETPIPLVARDTNIGPYPSCVHLASIFTTGCDVYEYENGSVHLVSSGTGASSHLVGISSDGSDVIINTTNALVPEDRDGGYGNLFDARVGGGFSFARPAAPCAGEGCRSPVPPSRA